MKRLLLSALVIAAAFWTPACSNLELAKEANPDRVLNGTVIARGIIPAGSEVLVRLLDLTPREAVKNPLAEMTTTVPRSAVPERVVAERSFSIAAQTGEAIPFQLPFSATDAELRHGLNLEVRISHGGKVRFRSINAHVVTQSSAPYPHEVQVELLP